MKSKFTLLIAALALLTMIVRPGRAWGQTTVTYRQISTSAVSVNSGTAPTGSTASFSTTYTNMNQLTGDNSMTLTLSGYDGQKITAITLSMKSNTSKGGGSLSVVAGTTTIASIANSKFNTSNWYGSWSTSYVDVNVTMTDDSYEIQEDEDVVITITASENSLYCQSFTLTYEDASGTLIPCNLALTGAPIALEFDLYNNSTAQVINYTTSSTGEVTINGGTGYVTTEIDQVNKTITVTPVAVTNGTKVITVNQAADDNYYAGSATFTVNITDSTPFAGGDVTFTAGTDMGTTTSNNSPDEMTKSGVTIYSTDAAFATAQYRIYSGSTTTISVNNNNVITSIVFTKNGSYDLSKLSTTTGSYNSSTGTWTGNAASIDFSASAQVRLEKIVVTVEAPSSVTAPTFSPESGTMFETSLDVTITPADGTTLYYTTDGTNPDNTGTGYTSAQIINLTETTTVKAIAYNGEEHSNVVSATYTKIAYDNIEDITEVGTAYSVKGTVVAVNSRGFIIGDGTGYVYYYNGSAPSQAVEDMVTISGTTGTYGQIIQFTNSASINEATSSNYDGTPAVSVITEVPDYSTGYHLSTYLQYEGTLSKSQDTYNNDIYLITVGETPIQISYPTDTQTTALENLIGSTVRVKGYFSGKNSSGYFTTMLESVEEIVVPTISANNIVLAYDDEEGTIEYTIVNAIVGGSLTAETEAEWIMLDAPDNGVIPFICDANTGAERIATVTLTYTYNTNETVTKNVTITQAAAPTPSIEVTPTMISDIAYDGAEGTLIVTATLVEDLDVAFYESDGTTPAEYDWITAEINGDNNVYYIVLENETEDARTAYMKVYGMDAETNLVYSDLITFSQKAYEVDYATLPFEFDGGRADIATTVGLTQEGLDSDYGSSPKLKFNSTGDWVILKFNETPGTLTFDIKGNSFSNSTFTVQTSTDGNTYTNLREYTELGATQSEEFTNLAADVRYIRWIYTNKDNGNVALGNIALTGYDYTPSITVSPDELNINSDGGAGELTVTHKNLADDPLLNVIFVESDGETITTCDWIQASINTAGNVAGHINANTGEARTAYLKVTGRDADNNLIKSNLVTFNQSAYTEPSIVFENTTLDIVAGGENRTMSFDYEGLGQDPTFSINFYESDGTTTATYDWIEAEITQDDKVDITVSANEGAARSAYFKVSGVNGEVNALSNLVTINQAAFVQLTTYSLVTSVDQIVSGKHYLIASSATNGAAYAMGGQTSNNRSGVAVTIENGQIAETENVYEFVINTHESSSKDVVYTIYDAVTPGYLYASSSSGNQLKTTTNLNGNGRWTIEFSATGEATIIAQGSNTRNVMRYNPNNNNPIFACYASTSTTGNLPCIYVKDNDTDYEYYGTEITYTETSIPDGETITIGTGSVMTVTNNFGNDNPAALVIEDGGQLVFDGTGVKATMKKKTVGESKAEHWYTIASPVNNIDLANITNLTNAATFDLYRYDEATYTWENYKNTAHTDFVTAENGRGYLYYNSDGNELSFAGELNNSASYDLTASGAQMNGLNLIGNPFTQDITLANISLSDDAQISEGFYVLSNNSDWVASVTTVKPCEGFIVKVNKATTATFSKSTGSSKSRANRDYIAFTVANNQYEDVAYAMFSNGLGLDKIDHRNAEIPMVYIPQNGQNYAIATMSDDTEMFNLNFKAMTTGQYTLSVDTKGNYSYLHIYDKMTNEDVDMLLEGEYSFIGSPRDDENRFVVKLSYNTDINEFDNDEIFAYQNGNDIIVNGEGELQVFDVTGKMILNTMINGIQTVNIPTTGMYIFRMVGTDVKTQKIVVR